MSRNRKALARWKHFESGTVPESLERAFSEIERPRTRYMNNATERTPPAPGNGAGMTQAGR